MVAILFFYPWGAVFSELGWYGYVAMLVFTIPLAVGLLYEWMRGGPNGDLHGARADRRRNQSTRGAGHCCLRCTSCRASSAT
jgi:hypothetical protein